MDRWVDELEDPLLRSHFRRYREVERKGYAQHWSVRSPEADSLGDSLPKDRLAAVPYLDRVDSRSIETKGTWSGTVHGWVPWMVPHSWYRDIVDSLGIGCGTLISSSDRFAEENRKNIGA